MTRRTVKDLDADLTKLKSEFDELKAKYDELSTKCNCLEKKYEGKNTNRSSEFKCKSCNEQFANTCDLKKQAKIHNLDTGLFKCGSCDKTVCPIFLRICLLEKRVYVEFLVSSPVQTSKPSTSN